MSEVISPDSPELRKPPHLYLVSYDKTSEHEAQPDFVFLKIDDSSMPEDEITQHISHMKTIYLAPSKFNLAASSLTNPNIIVHALLTELGVEADLDKMRDEAKDQDGALEDAQRQALQQTLDIERLFKKSIAYLDEKFDQKELHDFIDILDQHISLHHSNSTVLKARAQLIEELPNSKNAQKDMIITQRILWTMLYLNDTTTQ